MLKVLQVIDRLEIGGAERVFLDLTALLLNNNVSVDALTISAKGALYDTVDARANKFFLNRKNKYSLLKMWKCASICAQYDIVHVHMRHSYFYVRLSQLVSFRKFKIIFHDHFKLNYVPWSLKNLFKPKNYIGVSEYSIKWAKDDVKIPAEKIHLLRNTILATANDHDEIADGTPDWVMVSNIHHIKNIEFAIKLAKLCNLHLDIYGNTSDAEYSNAIFSSIKDYSNIRIIEGETNVQRRLKNYKIAMHTSFSETGPLVLLEYLANGLPFLAHYTGEVAQVIKDDIPECFVHSLNEGDWKIAIKQITENPPSSEKLIHLFNKYFGPDEYVNKCLKIYQEVRSY